MYYDLLSFLDITVSKVSARAIFC